MIEALLTALFLIAVGALGASGFIVSKRPDAKQLLEKMVPYQGIMGAVGVVWSIVGLISSVGVLTHGALGGAIIMLVANAALFGTGFLLAFPLIQSFNKNPQAKEKAEQLRSKLVAYQVPMGLTCIVMAILAIVRIVLKI